MPEPDEVQSALPSPPALDPPPADPPPADPTGQVFVPADDAPPENAEADDSEAPQRNPLRTATQVSGRVLLGIVVLAVLGAVVAATVFLRLPSVQATPASTVATPVPTAAQLVCPGALLGLGSSTGANANAPTAIGAPAVASAASTGSVLARQFTVSDAHTGSSPAAPEILTVPSGSAGARLAGAQSQAAASGDFSGLASAACASPSEDVWLVGGSTSVGRTTLLLLANPTAVDATVSLQIYGETGPVSAPGMDGITVAAGSQRVLPIAGFAPDLASPVVHVTSSGGQVLANLEQTTVRGVDPGGSDFVGEQTAPAADLTLPGVVISGSQGIQSLLGQSDYADLQPTLRLFVPGTRSATVSITVVAENGTVTGKPTTAKLQPGTVNDVPLDSLSEGSYTLQLHSTRPIVAGARTATAASAPGSKANDFAWTSAAPLLTAPTLVSVAPGMTATLHLANPSDAAETVQVRELSGSEQSISVPASSATSVVVDAGASYQLEGFSQLYASVSGAIDGGITSYAVPASTAGSAPVRIYG